MTKKLLLEVDFPLPGQEIRAVQSKQPDAGGHPLYVFPVLVYGLGASSPRTFSLP